jgi:encapsulin shell SprI-like protein
LTLTIDTARNLVIPDGQHRAGPALSLSTGAARQLATTTKSVPQTQGSTPRWLLRMLPWVEAPGGSYRVNRRLTSDHLRRYQSQRSRPANHRGEADIALAAGHAGEPALPGTFADYDASPREYELSLAQTILRVHTRVADLYSDPMDQAEQQLRLAISELRERQEAELLTNPSFGLLANAAASQRLHTRSGPPTPADLDELLCRRRKTRFFLAHPRAIAAFGRECSRRGVYPESVAVGGSVVSAWRGVPVLPCPKIPLTAHGVTSILAMRTGEADAGVIGLQETGLPDEREPGLSVRPRGIDAKGIISYLISACYSVAILVPDALGVLDNVEVTR